MVEIVFINGSDVKIPNGKEFHIEEGTLYVYDEADEIIYAANFGTWESVRVKDEDSE